MTNANAYTQSKPTIAAELLTPDRDEEDMDIKIYIRYKSNGKFRKNISKKVTGYDKASKMITMLQKKLDHDYKRDSNLLVKDLRKMMTLIHKSVDDRGGKPKIKKSLPKYTRSGTHEPITLDTQDLGYNRYRIVMSTKRQGRIKRVSKIIAGLGRAIKFAEMIDSFVAWRQDKPDSQRISLVELQKRMNQAHRIVNTLFDEDGTLKPDQRRNAHWLQQFGSYEAQRPVRMLGRTVTAAHTPTPPPFDPTEAEEKQGAGMKLKGGRDRIESMRLTYDYVNYDPDVPLNKTSIFVYVHYKWKGERFKVTVILRGIRRTHIFTRELGSHFRKHKYYNRTSFESYVRRLRSQISREYDDDGQRAPRRT